MARHLVLVMLFVTVVATPRVRTGERVLSLDEVIRRVGAYVDSYGEQASIVVATERYRQETKGNTSAFHGERLIVADFAIVNVKAEGWLGFRDVLAVDGRRLPDRADRLIRILTSEGSDYAEARRLSAESARFNIGTIERNFNVPTSTLFYFKAANLSRFKFTAKDVTEDGSWRIAWKETSRPSLIRTPDGASVPSEGELWVNPVDGTVLRTVLETKLKASMRGQTRLGAGRVDVTYRYVAPPRMWLPEQMIEVFEATAHNAWERLDGRADYGDYRQFQTTARIK